MNLVRLDCVDVWLKCVVFDLILRIGLVFETREEIGRKSSKYKEF